MTIIRCIKCGRLLMKGCNVQVEIKCPKCGYVQIINHKSKKDIDIPVGKAKIKQNEVELMTKTGVGDIIEARKHSRNNREEITHSHTCGCFHCRKRFNPAEITDWIEGEKTAVCPVCGVDSIIGDAAGFPITVGLLKTMKAYWF